MKRNKHLLWIGICLLGAFRVAAKDFRLADFGHAFVCPSANVVWGASYTNLPQRLAIYQSRPAQWSEIFLNNLTRTLGFNEPQKAMDALRPALRGSDVRYSEGSRGQSILLSPSIGKIQYMSPNMVALPGQEVVKVPEADAVESLALGVLGKLGIATNEIARRWNESNWQVLSNRTEMSARDLQTGVRKKVVTSRGVMFYRAADGIGFNGLGTCAGASIRFGNSNSIATMTIVWPKLELASEVQLPSRETVAKWIRDGRAVTLNMELDSAVKEISVVRVAPYYYAGTGEKPNLTIFPFAIIDALVTQDSRAVSVLIACPLVGE